MNNNDIELRRAYSEILNGFSIAKYRESIIYIKHQSSIDNFEIDFYFSEYLKEAVKRGFPSEEERLRDLSRDGLWTKEDDDKLNNIKNSIIENNNKKKKSFLKRDIDFFNNEIDKLSKEYSENKYKKEILLGRTAEKFAQKKIDSLFLLNNLFKDSSLKIPLFTKNEFDELDTNDLDELFSIYHESLSILSEENIKKISIKDFYLNSLSLSNDIYQFFGKPVSLLTYNQINLYAYGNYFKGILTSEIKPPVEIMDDPQKIEDWWHGRNNIEELKNKNKENTDISLVGLTNEDRKFLGLEENNSNKVRQKIEENGGELSMFEIMKLEGVI